MAESSLDRFRTAIASASRAIARDAEVDVVFASESGNASGKIARVVSPGPSLEPRLVAEARGAADSAALQLRHHDSKLHTTRAPVDADARAVFDALEVARVEALGSRAMGGVRANLDKHVEARVRLDAIGRARSAEEVPLATAIGLLARERLTGAPPPESARPGLKLVAPWIEEKAGAELDALALTIDDQGAFAELSKRLLEDLDLEADSDQAPQEPEEQGGDDDPGEGDSAEEGDDQDQASGAEQGEMEARSEQSEEGDGESDASDQQMEEGEPSSADEGGEQASARSARRNWQDEPPTDYRPYTTRFDEVVEAADMLDLSLIHI